MAISQSDWRIVKQHVIQVQVEVIVKNSDGSDAARLSGIVNGGDTNIDSGSAVKRTASFSLTPSEEINNIGEESLIWLNKRVEVCVGILDQRNRTNTTTHNGYSYKGTYRWYKMGTFIYNNANVTFDASNNILSIELSDLAVQLDGTTNGQIGGALSTIYQAYEEDPVTGQPIKYTTIKQAVIDTLKSAHVDNYYVQDIGEYYGMPQSGAGYQEYRREHPLWNKIPYDLEFSAAATVWEVLDELVTLYPAYDAGYDENGVLRVEMIPTEFTEENDFYYEDYMDMLISEQETTDLTKVRNVCEVWGSALDADYYSEGVCKGGAMKYEVLGDFEDDVYVLHTKIMFVPTGTPEEEAKVIEEHTDSVFENLSFEKTYHALKIVYDNINGSADKLLSFISLGNLYYESRTFPPNTTIGSEAYGVPVSVGVYEDVSPTYGGSHGRFVIICEGFTKYENGRRIGVKFAEGTSGEYEWWDFMCVNDLEPLGIVDSSTRQILEEGVLDSKHIHVFQLVRIYRPEFDDYNFQWWYVGISQSHALDVLSDGTEGELVQYIDPDTGIGEWVNKYSKRYFELFYNCDTVSITVCQDSPYVVQKLGELLDMKTEGEFNNITSNQLALERAQYENWKNSRLTDNITITTKLMPFVKPYMKIDYKKKGSKIKNDYIIQSVSHDFESGTTTIQMYTFYSLYKRQPGECDKMTYKYMSGFLNEDLYGNEDLR